MASLLVNIMKHLLAVWAVRATYAYITTCTSQLLVSESQIFQKMITKTAEFVPTKSKQSGGKFTFHSEDPVQNGGFFSGGPCSYFGVVLQFGHGFLLLTSQRFCCENMKGVGLGLFEKRAKNVISLIHV